MLYHYTSLESFCKIMEGVFLNNGEPFITLHASRLDRLNDPTEMKIDIRVLQSILHEYEIQHNVEDSNCLSKKIEGLNPNQINKILEEEKNTHAPYIMCFSTKKDFLPMWSLYGNKSHGVCLCFDESRIKGVEGSIIQGNVAYNQYKNSSSILMVLDLYYNIMLKDIQNIDIYDTIAELFLFISPFIKNINYAYEKEFRICHYCFQADLNFSIDNNITNYKEVDIVDFNIPLSSLKSVILGSKTPSILMDMTQDYFNKKYDIKFVKSKIPFK